ncbi:methionine ABC transporter ATP-binding protein [Terrihabitans sp. B22-R8]|uniref:methionine ABC transporter ATP-binding protein n=1 Tax=Terrihabitans sp. B22-R8 TaxID=3425128 RepID=UPI00403CFE2D
MTDESAGDVPPRIVIENARKVFPGREGRDAFVALDDISLDVAAGEILSVIGRSGAGKSTLLRLVNGLEQPTSGRVVVEGMDISVLAGGALRDAQRSIGMIFQHFNLLSSRTVYGNVALPLEIAGFPKAQMDGRILPLLDLVGLADRRHHYPAELSGGQKQRVGIARALANRPKVLLSDEATSALDPETTEQILGLLRTVKAEFNLTIVLITHEMSVVKAVADRVAVLERGALVEQGATFEIFARPQHRTTRSFLGTVTGSVLPSWLRERLSDSPIPGGATLIRIVFIGENAPQPVLTRLARTQDLDVNILSGQVDEIGGRPFGTLVVSLPTDPERDGRFLTALRDLGLAAEVIGYVR